jgi:hypothetical protein
MNATEFVIALSACAPDTDALKRQGYESSLVAEFHDSYIAVPNTMKSSNPDPLIALLSEYDLSSIVIGMVTFRRDPVEHSWGHVIGYDEADPIVVESATGRIQIRDHASLAYVICSCAASSSQFLDAMANVACFSSRCKVEPSLYDDNDEKLRQAHESARLAGGNDYLRFYIDAVGYEENG